MKKSPAELSDDEVHRLLGRLAERDERALRELHELFARRIYLFAVSRLRDEDAAQTVMIDTLFEVWKHPDRFRGESRFSTWLLGIAKYKVLTAFRSRARRGREGGGVDTVDTAPAGMSRRWRRSARCSTSRSPRRSSRGCEWR